MGDPINQERKNEVHVFLSVDSCIYEGGDWETLPERVGYDGDGEETQFKRSTTSSHRKE